MSDTERSTSYVDYESAWQCLGQEGEAPHQFRQDIDSCLTHYRWKRVPLRQTNMRECTRHFDKLANKAAELSSLLSESENKFSHLLFDSYDDELSKTENGDCEYSDFTMGTENEGMEYFDVQLLALKELLSELNRAASTAPKYHKVYKGRPQINHYLEGAILGLANIYTDLTGNPPGKQLTINSEGHSKPVQGPFMDFVTTVLWSHAGKEIPENSAIGEAARKALGLRK
ncbi:hypothetical protein XMM379_002585 [Aliiroseovarius sp. xm-m-379]|uniref:hypothetical protein n=1 Tax=unclassified Aliiroseovarius TaxID=2623558 RepID=UPI001567CE8B|nr:MULTISPECIES: hypothetical protein [unclassified Aliiroseovarius]NRP25880.1 hypothetical protein [Aliiroseovarius sp. xm-m-379]NRP34679.1 hypothetical protein [Aliiroseovarius sp. xm-a-104]NRP49805.1 hypothetical protein [Aliiroseovarius sp. xm-m-354]NRQ04559.1 hypothetical protein [Aliiroseovarius sp. xm-m-309]NRQ07763.1 hypothetical protein [Aliiroseovarius sp. xm-v-201]